MRRLSQIGLTLIEMMVSMLIGSLLIVAILIVMSGRLNTPGSGVESSRRTAGSGADLDQAGSIAMFQIEKWARSAGTGFAQTVASPKTYSYAYGCQLFAAKGSTQLLPLPSGTPLPAPFNSSTTFLPSSTAGVFKLLPALIIPGATSPNMTNMVSGSSYTSDALVLMSSGNGYGEVPTPFTASGTTSQLTVPNTTALSGANANDLLLVADQQPDATTAGSANCLVTQAALTTTDGTATTLPLGGSWYASSGVAGVSSASYSSTGVVLDLGDPSATSTQPPSFQVIGVGDNNTLYSYDLLGVETPQLQARGENVFELHALYGIDSDGDGKVDNWIAPGATGNYSVATLTNGSVTSSALIKTIKALRIGLILRTELPERNVVAASTSVTLFSDLSAYVTPYSRSFSTTEQVYRYRTVEATIPVRNNSF